MLSFKDFLTEEVSDENDQSVEQYAQDKIFGAEDYIPVYNNTVYESVEEIPDEPKKLLFKGKPHQGRAVGVRVPRHMWEGANKSVGMRERNKARAEVYGAEQRQPLTKPQIHREHAAALAKHFAKPIHEQIAAETAALARLRNAKHISPSALTTDTSEKQDTVNYETDSEGRGYGAISSKGVAGHAVYTSGTGENEEHHILRTCTGATAGCGGGLSDEHIADTSKGSCFAPKAEAQYPDAAIRRACHEQAKHDPAMTTDWIIAHVGSIRKESAKLDKQGKTTVFRPNIVDETDTTSRLAIKGLNKQRKIAGLPLIIGNGYGKTDDIHDPEHGWYSVYSNTGPKVKDGGLIGENIKRNNSRIKQTILAHNGETDFTNDEGNLTPPKNSYMLINVKRGSHLADQFAQNVTHAKYWSIGRERHELSGKELAQGDEGHYDGNGNPTSPDKSHYGHITLNGRRYDYQRQHILHPRMVDVPIKKRGVVTIHQIPSDSRFKDDSYLPEAGSRFKSPNGKLAGGILVTTPTESTSNAQHHNEFTHHVDESTIEHARMNNGEYEIDSPHQQEAARNSKPYVPMRELSFDKKIFKRAKMKQ